MENKLLPYKNLLKKYGYSFTSQCQMVLEEIISSNTHLSAKVIYERLKNKHVGLATVYRHLKSFENSGIVKGIHDNGMNLYELKIFSGSPLHIHFKCFKCHSIIDINDSQINIEYLKLNRLVERNLKSVVYDANIMLLGLCEKCRREEKCQDPLNLEE